MSEIIDSDKIERHEMYTLWQKIGSRWVIERSYVGHYVLSALWFGVEQSGR